MSTRSTVELRVPYKGPFINIADCAADRVGDNSSVLGGIPLPGVRSDSSSKKVSDLKLPLKIRLKSCLPYTILCHGESRSSLLRPNFIDEKKCLNR